MRRTKNQVVAARPSAGGSRSQPRCAARCCLYGFEDSQEGLGQMWAALKPFLDDKCLAEMAETVRSEFEVLEPDEEPAPSKAESPPETLAVEGTFYTKPAHWSQQRVWVLPRYLSDVHSWTVFLDITEGMTVGDLRGCLKPYFCGVSESRLRLQYFSGAILKDLPDTADASRAIAMFITHAVPSRHPEDCRPVSKEQILGIQKECLERFSTPEFQKELEGLIRKVHKNAPCYGINQKRPLIWIVPGRFELIKKVQEQVFPRYGFERGLKSMAAVSAAFDPWIHDVDIVEICEKVNTQLALPPQLYDLRRLTF